MLISALVDRSVISHTELIRNTSPCSVGAAMARPLLSKRKAFLQVLENEKFKMKGLADLVSAKGLPHRWRRLAVSS